MEGQVETVQPEDNTTTAAVSFATQDTPGDTVVIKCARLNDGGFVAIHDSSLQDGNTVDSVIGVSGYLESGKNEEVEIALDEPLREDNTLIAMPHRDTNDSQEYEFVESGAEQDGPLP